MPRRALPRSLHAPRLAGLAAVLADPSRAEMLDVLLDGDAHAIGALARRVGIAAATASSHLRRLEDARLVRIEAVGRERRVRLAGSEVADVLERLAVLGTPGPSFVRVPDMDRLRFGRTCYDHLAGFLGVAITTRLCDIAWLEQRDDAFVPAAALLAWLADRGHAVEGAADVRRPLARACIDWTERVPHIAGRTGAAIAAIALEQQWVARVRASRALRVTERGRRELRELGVSLR